MPREKAGASPIPTLTADQKHRLAQIHRFLANVADPEIGRDAARHGYDGKEHAYGWEQWKSASGVDRPFEHALTRAMHAVTTAASDEVAARYRVINAFEDKWLPRTRNAIRRHVAAEQREAVEAAFFEGLSQQPEGPGVVSSVGLFLVRFEQLRKSKVDGVKEAIVGLRKKGLTDELLEQMGALVEQARAVAPAVEDDEAHAEDVARANARQLEAYDKVNRWYIDWADTLRAELTYHQGVKLGIIAVKGGRRSSPGDDQAPEQEGG